MNKKIITFWHARAVWVLYVAVAMFTVYCVFRDIRRTDGLIAHFSGEVDKALNLDEGEIHPFLVVRFVQDRAFVDAIKLINKTPVQRFWVEAYTLDPTMNLNYFIYPKEARMDVDVQFDLYSFLLHKIERPPTNHPAPKYWEKKLLIRQRAEIVEK